MEAARMRRNHEDPGGERSEVPPFCNPRYELGSYLGSVLPPCGTCVPGHPGLTERVQRYVDDPNNPLHDQLAPGEQVLAEFDVCKFQYAQYFPGLGILGNCPD